MAFPAWVPPGSANPPADGGGGVLLKAGWENQRSGSGGDTASSFLQGLKSQFGSSPPGVAGGGGGGGGGEGGGNWQQQMQRLYSQPPPQQQSFHPSYSPTHTAAAGAGGSGGKLPQYTHTTDQSHAGGAQPVVYESALLTEDEFQASSAIEYGSGISLSGCTIDRHLGDGDLMPQLETLSASVTLRITPTAIVFLHHYDRNFILEVPVSELYEINEDSESKVVLLHTRSANGSALLELQCGSSRKRLAIYKVLCIRKNALERLKRQQQYLSKGQ